jgi:glycosyltransferase involved in cell wall biosynthesis
MPKVAIVTPYGAEDRLDVFAEFIVAKGLAQRGHEVRFYTYRIRSNPDYAETKKNYKGIQVTRCPQKYGFSPRLIWELIRWRPDVIILCHIRNALSYPAYLVARLVGAKVLFQVVGLLHDPHVVGDRDNPLETIRPEITLLHTLGQFIRYAWKTRNLIDSWENYAFHAPLYKADERITVTEFERGIMKKLVGLDSNVIPWGVPARDPNLHEQKPVMRDGRTLPETYFFYIGQVKKRKGWDTIIEALAILKAQGLRKNLVFVTSSNPSEYQEAIDLVKAHGLEDQVYFLFKISNQEKEWLYMRTEATLTPSRYEGFGLPVFESWVHDKPVLGTDIPVYQDFLIDGETGLVSKKGDPVTLAENIKRLQDQALRTIVIEGGRRKAHEYNDERIVALFEESICRTLGVPFKAAT